MTELNEKLGDNFHYTSLWFLQEWKKKIIS